MGFHRRDGYNETQCCLVHLHNLDADADDDVLDVAKAIRSNTVKNSILVVGKSKKAAKALRRMSGLALPLCLGGRTHVAKFVGRTNYGGEVWFVTNRRRK